MSQKNSNEGCSNVIPTSNTGNKLAPDNFKDYIKDLDKFIKEAVEKINLHNKKFGLPPFKLKRDEQYNLKAYKNLKPLKSKLDTQEAVIIPEFKMSCNMRLKTSQLYSVSSSRDYAYYTKSLFEEGAITYKELFYVLFLNRSKRITGFMKVSEGGVTGTIADPRIILQAALMAGATELVLCHNHPSGSLMPSKQDVELTTKIKEAAKYLDITVLDHVIISEEGFYSFADEGLM
jgi:DNA repair protein RadC